MLLCCSSPSAGELEPHGATPLVPGAVAVPAAAAAAGSGSMSAEQKVVQLEKELEEARHKVRLFSVWCSSKGFRS